MAWSLFTSGVSPLSWADSVLARGGWPKTQANRQSLIAWAINEGGGGTFNPLNSTQGSGSDFNSVGVKNYGSWSVGVDETVATINNGFYPDIVSDLKSGKGISSNAGGDLHTWSGAGYSSITGTWTEAAQYLSGKSAPLPSQTGAAGGAAGAGATGGPPGVGIFGWLQALMTSLGTGADTAAEDLNPLKGISDVAQSIVGLAQPLVKFAQAIDWFFVPSHWVRILSGVGGGVLVVMGLNSFRHIGGSPGILQRAGAPVPEASGTMALALGIGEVGLGSVLLFVAFHNVSPDVKSFGGFVSDLQSRVQTDLAATASGAGTS